MPFLTRLEFATSPRGKPEQAGEVRRVLNGASKFHGKSLNSYLLTGPGLLQDLLNVLLRFRQYQYAVPADIEGMFLQVGVPPPDQTCLRFCGGRTLHRMWRDSSTRDTFLWRETRRRALTLRFNKQLETKKPLILLLQKPSIRSSIWTTTSILLSVLKLL